MAQWVSNAAVFVLFLLNGLRLPRARGVGGDVATIGCSGRWCCGCSARWRWAGWAGVAGRAAAGCRRCWRWGSSTSAACPRRCNRPRPIARSRAAMSRVRWWRRPCSISSACSSPRRCFRCWRGAGGGVFDADGLDQGGRRSCCCRSCSGRLLQGRFGGWVKEHRALADADGPDLDRDRGLRRLFGRGRAALLDADRPGGLAVAGRAGAGCCWCSAMAAHGCWAALSGSTGPTGSPCCSPARRRASRWARRWPRCCSRPAVAGIVLLPILLYHLAQLVIAAPLASAAQSDLTAASIPSLRDCAACGGPTTTAKSRSGTRRSAR